MKTTPASSTKSPDPTTAPALAVVPGQARFIPRTPS